MSDQGLGLEATRSPRGSVGFHSYEPVRTRELVLPPIPPERTKGAKADTHAKRSSQAPVACYRIRVPTHRPPYRAKIRGLKSVRLTWLEGGFR